METACNESMRMGIKNFAAGDGTVPQSVLIFDAILSASPDFHYIFDLQHRFTYANPSLLKLWGKTLGEVVGKNFEDLGYPPELVKLHEKQLNEALLGNTVRGENSYTNHEGKTGYYEYIFVPIFDKSGKIQAISGTTRDITERRHREEVKVQEQRHVHHIEQIKNNERILDQIFFESPAFMTFMSGPEHIYERANKKFYEFTGLNSSILGKKVVDVFP